MSFDFGAHVVVIKEFISSFLDAWQERLDRYELKMRDEGQGASGLIEDILTLIYIWEIGAKSGDWLEDCLSAP